MKASPYKDPLGQVQVSADGKTVWVHAMDGSTVGRFSKVFGLDVHRTITQQLAGANQCLHCTHTPPTQEDWLTFCRLMEMHFQIRVDPQMIQIEDSTGSAHACM